MDKESLNYYHTNIVIPNMILANKDFFLSNILKNPHNMECFIAKDTYSRACQKKDIKKSPINCNLTANEINNYFLVYAEFSDEYSDYTKAIAIANKGSIIRYFTYELNKINDKNCYFVCELVYNDARLDKHLNYGQTNECKMTLFAGKVADILEGKGD